VQPPRRRRYFLRRKSRTRHIFSPAADLNHPATSLAYDRLCLRRPRWRVKYAHILIVGNERQETFDFALPIPGAAHVGTSARSDSIYPGRSIDLGLETLRTKLEEYQCCTTNSGATRDSDPLNFVVVESGSDPIVPLLPASGILLRSSSPQA
jgi:hypothetical protein